MTPLAIRFCLLLLPLVLRISNERAAMTITTALSFAIRSSWLSEIGNTVGVKGRYQWQGYLVSAGMIAMGVTAFIGVATPHKTPVDILTLIVALIVGTVGPQLNSRASGPSRTALSLVWYVGVPCLYGLMALGYHLHGPLSPNK